MFMSINKPILKTIIYFDLFDWPLTALEIHKYLYKDQASTDSVTLQDVIDCLDNDEQLRQHVSAHNGFYFLSLRQAQDLRNDNIVEQRLEKHRIASEKWPIAVRAVKWLRLIPFLRFAGVCNNLSYNNAKGDSDIDLLIVAKPGRIWTVRLLVTMLISVLGIRRHGQKITDRICLSFYVTENHLNFEPLAYKPRDTHFTYWIAMICPLFDLGIWSKFRKANEKWLADYLVHPEKAVISTKRQVRDNVFSRFIRRVGELIFGWPLGGMIEKIVRKLQRKKIYKHKDSKVHEDNTDVVVGDDVLKFHETDTRKAIQKEFEKRAMRI